MKLPEKVWYHDDLTDKEWRLLVACLSLANSTGEFQASADRLSKMIGSDLRYTFKILGRMTHKGYMTTLKGGSGRAPAKRKLSWKALQ